MADILIRGVPDDVVAAIDSKAQRAGLSRTEYLWRALTREGRSDTGELTLQSLQLLAERFVDLEDPEVIGRAWS